MKKRGHEFVHHYKLDSYIYYYYWISILLFYLSFLDNNFYNKLSSVSLF